MSRIWRRARDYSIDPRSVLFKALGRLINESCPTYEWVMSRTHCTWHIDISSIYSILAVSFFKGSGDLYTSHVPHMKESCPTYERVMSHIWTSHVPRGHISSIYSILAVSFSRSRATYKWVTSHIWRVMSHIWTSHAPLMNESCHAHMAQGLSRLFTRFSECRFQGLGRLINEACPTYKWVMSHIWTSHVPLMNESCHAHMAQGS